MQKKGITSIQDIVEGAQQRVNREKASIKNRLKKFIVKLNPDDCNRIKEEFRVRI